MPPSPARSASTLASTGAPVSRATAASRATSPGLAAGSRPTLLSPQATRSGRASAGRARLSRSLARNRSSTGPTTPGWTNATRTVPAEGGAGRQAQKPSAARGRAAAATAASARVAPGTPGATAAATATLTATSRKLSPQIPPRAATASRAGAFHWLAPSSPQGPPSPSQERSASPTTNALGTSARAAASRPGVGPTANPAPPPRGGPVDRAFPPRGGPVDNPASPARGGAGDNQALSSRGWATLPVGVPDTGGSGSGAAGVGAAGVGAAEVGAAGARVAEVGAGPSRDRASQPAGSQVTARSIASGAMNGPTVGTRKALTARKKPVPPSQARSAASRPFGAAMAISSSGTSPTRASHHQPGRGKARASGAPSSNAASRPPHLLTGVPPPLSEASYAPA